MIYMYFVSYVTKTGFKCMTMESNMLINSAETVNTLIHYLEEFDDDSAVLQSFQLLEATETGEEGVRDEEE